MTNTLTHFDVGYILLEDMYQTAERGTKKELRATLQTCGVGRVTRLVREHGLHETLYLFGKEPAEQLRALTAFIQNNFDTLYDRLGGPIDMP
ncbi:MAG: hypothetical protein Q7R96_06195 [Nanoarchaeota archaeon]|nr:hypothetical protein [Nanoarchaeota archaeon]